MSFILIIIFTIIVFGIMIFASLIRGISSFLFGKPSSYSGNGSERTSSSWSRSQHNTHSPKQHNKVFAKDEGEYVPFEEIKD